MKRLSAAAIAAALLLWFFWGNFSLDCTQREICLRRLDRAFDRFRIVHLSDLHGRSFGRENSRLLQAVAQAQPDLICITGDLFDENTPTERILPLLRALGALAPVYYVTGNHEWQVKALPTLLAAMQEAGVQVLRGSYHLLCRGGARLVIAGVDDPCGPADAKTPEALVQEIHDAVGREVPIVMLDHRNDHLVQWQALGVDLVLSGHCHGGLVRVPLLGGLIGPGGRLLPRFDAGLYRSGGTALYVSRGLASPRLLNRPEVAVLVLRHS